MPRRARSHRTTPFVLLLLRCPTPSTHMNKSLPLSQHLSSLSLFNVSADKCYAEVLRSRDSYMRTAQPPSHEAASENDDDDDEDARQSQQKTAGARSPLFWVNTDPQTVKRGSKEEQLKRIRSHVMSEHNRKKRLENTRRYNKSKTWKNLAYRPEPVGTSKHPRASGSSLSSPTSSSASDRSSSKSSASPENREDSPPGTLAISRSSGSLTSETSWVQSTSPSSTQDLLLDQLSAAPRQDSFATSPPFIGSDGIDPFQATQVQLSQTQYQHLKYCMLTLNFRLKVYS